MTSQAQAIEEGDGGSSGSPVFVNRQKFLVDADSLTGRQILDVAGLGEGYDLFLLQGEGDPTGGRCVLADEPVEIRPGLRFNALPGNCTFGDD